MNKEIAAELARLTGDYLDRLAEVEKAKNLVKMLELKADMALNHLKLFRENNFINWSK